MKNFPLHEVPFSSISFSLRNSKHKTYEFFFCSSKDFFCEFVQKMFKFDFYFRQLAERTLSLSRNMFPK